MVSLTEKLVDGYFDGGFDVYDTPWVWGVEDGIGR